MSRKEKLTFLFVGIIVCFYSFIITKRNKDWRTAIGFYEKTASYSPTYRVLNNLGTAYAEKGFILESGRAYHAAIQANPNDPIVYHNIANCFLALGEKDMAILYFKKSLEIDPNFIFSKNRINDINNSNSLWTD